MPRRNWTQEESEYLQERWGVVSIKAIAKNLERSINSVKLKAARLNMGDPRMNFEGITVCQLGKALGREYNVMKTWLKRYGLPAKKKIFCQESRVFVISYAEFWKWAEQHKELLNFAKMEPNILGPEPNWVKVKRTADTKRSQRTWQSVDWTAREDQLLIQLVQMKDMTYPDLAKQLDRSEASVKRRLYDLHSKYRPQRLNNHIKYTPKEIEKLMHMAQQGYGYESIAQEIGKSALGVRGKLERMKFNFKQRKFPEQLSM